MEDANRVWGADPADRWVMVRTDVCTPPLWRADGMVGFVEGLPAIPTELADRIEAFAARYEELDDANDRFPNPFYWEQRADFPVDAFNEEGRAIARALKAALPADWTVIYEDADAWLRPKGEPLERRQLILAGTPGGPATDPG